MSDEREGLPSASAFSRYALCPGSWALEQTIPEERTSDDAAMGTRIHAALAGERVQLNDDENRIADLCTEHEARLVIDTFGPVVMSPVREERLWGYDHRLQRTFSGKPDAVYVHDGRALLIDYKTGRGSVEHASENLQLRALAVLAADKWEVHDVTVAIIQPMAGHPTTARYRAEDLDRAFHEVKGIVDLIRLPHAPRRPSADACKWCRGKALCPEAREAAVAPVLDHAPVGITPDAMAATLTSETLGLFLERAAMAESIIEACRAEARRRISEGEKVKGWKLKEGATRETITKPETVFARFCEAGGTSEQFLPVVTVAKAKLKDALKSVTGAKGKDLETKLSELLEGCTESKQTAPSLVQE